MNFKEFKEYLELLKYSGIDEMVASNNEASIFNFNENNKEKEFELLKKTCLKCKKCQISQSRHNVVFGDGNISSKLLIIGEAPGKQEDLTGNVFIGEAGQLLTKMLKAINIDRKDVFIANILKCRPTNNRNPNPEEVSNCLPYLDKQIELIQPEVILLFGRVAATNLLGIEQNLGDFRLKTFSYKNIPVFVTYHPSALLRNPNWKKNAWADLQYFQKFYNSLR